VGVGLGALTALIPFRQHKYGRKLQFAFPICTSTTLIVLLLSFGHLAYLEKVKGIKAGPLVKYDNIEVPKTLDCLRISNGKFETENLIITRQGDKQTQIKKDTKETKEFKVEWLSDCEYILTPFDNPTEKLKVKITSVRDGEYDCYVSLDKYAQRHTIKRIKNGS
jgi:hypothetical protein